MKPDFGKPKSQVCLLAKANKQTLPRQGVPPWISRGFAAGQPTRGSRVGMFMLARVWQGFLPFRFV
jgi:hypothetical protein